jgi:hypothetical protein
MWTHVEARLPQHEQWLPARLTDERCYGHPVVILEGESISRSPIELFMVRPVSGTDEILLEGARHAGYVVLHH